MTLLAPPLKGQGCDFNVAYSTGQPRSKILWVSWEVYTDLKHPQVMSHLGLLGMRTWPLAALLQHRHEPAALVLLFNLPASSPNSWSPWLCISDPCSKRDCVTHNRIAPNSRSLPCTVLPCTTTSVRFKAVPWGTD